MKNLCARLVGYFLIVWSSLATAQVLVTTYQYNNYRWGANPHETVLTPANVNPNQFGRVAVFNVQGAVYAQPLYVPNLTISGTAHNVLFIATEHDQVYAFDVNSGQQLWHTNFLAETTNPLLQILPLSNNDVQCTDLAPEIGITGTPVIDLASNELFVVANTKEHDLRAQTTTFFQTLHALDIRTGMERNPPHRIVGRVPGTGQGSQGGFLTFDPLIHGQRAALLLQSGQIFVGFGSHCDNFAYHGWLMAFNETTLFSSGMFVDTPNAREGGIWGGAAGPAADSGGSIYTSTGNGTFDASSGGTDFGDSILRLTWSSANLTITLSDYFTPWDQQTLDVNDRDVASGGVLLLPDQPGSHYPHLLVQAGKEGTIDLVNRDNLGHFHSGDDSQIVQTIPYILGPVFGGPAFWNNNLYIGGVYDHLKAFAFDPQAQLLSVGPTSQSPEGYIYPSPTPSVSSNGASNGIVWAIECFGGANAVLRAYDANNLATELYNSEQNPGRDRLGVSAKFAVPVVADGHVFAGAQNQVAMYGLVH